MTNLIVRLSVISGSPAQREGAGALHEVTVAVIPRPQRRADSKQVGQKTTCHSLRPPDRALQDHRGRLSHALSSKE